MIFAYLRGVLMELDFIVPGRWTRLHFLRASMALQHRDSASLFRRPQLSDIDSTHKFGNIGYEKCAQPS